MPLLGPADPPPFEIINGDGPAPFLLICDHASARVPSSLDLKVAKEAFDQHVAWDIGAADAARHLSRRFDAALILSGYSRLVIDCNRRPDSDHLCPPVSDGICVPLNETLCEATRAERIAALYTPYHEAIEAWIAARRAAGHVPAIISIHSCTPVMNGFQRPWHIGVLWNEDGRIAQPLIQRLSADASLCIGDNEPYTGKTQSGHSVPHHAERNRLPHVMVEIRQDLIGTREQAERWADILGDALAPVLADAGLYRLFE